MNFVDKDQLEAWGSRASEQYLKKNIPLNESIEKIAVDNSLNEHQIKRVSEFANIITNLEMFEKEADKRFSFEQANYKDIMSKLEKEDESEKTASASGFYDEAPVNYKNSFEKVASKEEEEVETPADLLDMLDKTAEAIFEMNAEKMAAEAKYDMIEDSIYNDIKQYVLSGDYSFKEVCAACLDHADTYYKKGIVKEALMKSGINLCDRDLAVSKNEVTKLASMAPDDYIAETFDSPDAPVMVRNGNLNLYYMLDTLVDQKERVSKYDKPLLHLNDNVRYIKRKLVSY